MKTARSLCTIFSHFSHWDGRAATEEIEIAFDFVRNLFPDTNHQALGQILEESLSQQPPLSPHLAFLKRVLTKEQKTAFGLQLYSLVHSADPSSAHHFVEAMKNLGVAQIGQAVVLEMSTPNAHPSKILPRIDFSDGPHGDVHLAKGEVPRSFRCYRAGGIILIRNLSHSPLSLRGYRLTRDRLIQFRPDDDLLVGDWKLGYDDLNFFFNENSPSLYLLLDHSDLTMSRTRGKNAIASIRFGCRAHVTPIKHGVLFSKGDELLLLENNYKFDYHDDLIVEKGEPISLDALRRLSLESGHRFRLPTGRRKVIVSNDHSQLSGDSLLLTPGLASRFILEIDFDPATGLGDLTVLESTRPVLANGREVGKCSLPDGSLIRLSSRQALRCRFSENLLDEERNLVRTLEVAGVNYAFWKGGKAINNLSFQVNRGQMVCIIGPSGSGKSTLLEVLAGQRSPQSGSVRLNGLSLYERQRRLSPLISFMPQEEALFAQLTSREHLTHACSIRRPHLSISVIQKRVNHLLLDLGLDHIADRIVGSATSKSLSGGERSRLNAGLDLIGGGEVFLFDEPISGLSSKDAEHVVQALAGLARDKIVIASLHRPSQKVLESFQRVLLLDNGGKMAFFGRPDEMIGYFENAAIELELPDSQSNGADFVFDTLEAPILSVKPKLSNRVDRRFPPSYWQERFENKRVMAQLTLADPPTIAEVEELPTAEDQIPAPEPPKQGRRQLWKIFCTHFTRSLLSKFRHRGTLYSILLEAPILAFLISYTLHASAEGRYTFHSALHLPSYLFLSITVAMFFGLTNSATEILRDRPVLRRERNCRPQPALYLGAKFLILTGLLTFQSFIFTYVGNKILEIHGMLFSHLGWMILTGSCGTALALLVSTVAKSERSAVTSIPLILVPQILLAGALVPFGEMNRGLFSGASEAREAGAEPVPSALMPLRYAYEGAVVSQASKNQFEKTRRNLQRQLDHKKESPSKTLQLSKERLGILFAASAENIQHAQEILADPIREKNRLMLEPSTTSPSGVPLPDFFVNQRIEGMVELAEAKRLDKRFNHHRNVFLAEEKTLFGFSITTIRYCQMILVGSTTLLLGGAAFILKISLNRH